jgi:polysaccharide biosynthesis protein PslG
MRRLPWLGLIAAAAIAAGCGGDGEDASGGGDAGEGEVPRSFWGVVSGTELNEEELSRMGDGNVGTLRELVLWPEIEPAADDQYDWSKLDPLVAGAAENGIELLPFVYGTPAWAVGNCHGYDPLTCQRIPPLQSEQAKAAWQDLLRDLVARYGPDGSFWSDDSDPFDPPEVPITQWQIWNEPSSLTYFRPEPSPERYAELLELSHEAITEVDPEAEIVLAGLFGEPRRAAEDGGVAWEYLANLYEMDGIEETFDVVAMHPYAESLEEIEFQFNKMLRVIDEAGDSEARIWVTELGWGSAEPIPNAPLVKGPDGQRDLLAESFDLLRANREPWRLEGVIWYQWKDLPEKFKGCEFCASAGLFDLGGEPKPAWEAFLEYSGGEA